MLWSTRVALLCRRVVAPLKSVAAENEFVKPVGSGNDRESEFMVKFRSGSEQEEVLQSVVILNLQYHNNNTDHGLYNYVVHTLVLVVYLPYLGSLQAAQIREVPLTLATTNTVAAMIV